MNSLIDSVRAAVASELAYYEMLERCSGMTATTVYAHACASYMRTFAEITDTNAIDMARLLLQWKRETLVAEKDPHAPWAPILSHRLELVERDASPNPTNEFEELLARRMAKKAAKRTEEEEEAAKAKEAWGTLDKVMGMSYADMASSLINK